MAKEKRFEVVQEQNSFSTNCRVLLDTVTGVQYLFVQSGMPAGSPRCWTGTASPCCGTFLIDDLSTDAMDN